jgi:hypothetical protein
LRAHRKLLKSDRDYFSTAASRTNLVFQEADVLATPLAGQTGKQKLGRSPFDFEADGHSPFFQQSWPLSLMRLLQIFSSSRANQRIASRGPSAAKTATEVSDPHLIEQR